MNYETSIRANDDLLLASEDSEARRARRRRLILIAAVVLIAAVAAVLLFGRSGDGAAAPAGEGEGGARQVPTVSVVTPGRQAISREISATGSLAARRDMPVGVVGEGGLVTRVLVEPGQWVKDGQVLAVIERSVQAQQIDSLQAQVGVAQADLRLAENELERARQLVSRGFISQADVDRRTATRDAARARVEVARAQLAEQRARVGRLDIRAPAAGLVLARSVEPGQVVGAGTGTLFRIAMGGEIEMRAQLAQPDLARLKEGMPARVVPVGSDQAYTGRVWQVAPIVDPQTRQGIARIALGYEPALRPGGFASATIITDQVEAPLLPESAVQSDERGNFVYIVGADNKVVRRGVTTGEVSDRGVAIIAGLTGEERVVLSAGGFLNPGELVKPVRVAGR